MEKDNKYYSIIADIVKKHRKFSGLETILDDLIDDVYKHSEVIINSVQNENVIYAYLEKVVATSIITVPKKLNFHSELKHTMISHISTPATNVNNTLVDKMINGIDNEVVIKHEPENLPDNNNELNDILEENNQKMLSNNTLLANENDLEELASSIDNSSDDETFLKLENDTPSDSQDELNDNSSKNDIEEFISNTTDSIIDEEHVQDSTQFLDFEELEHEEDKDDDALILQKTNDTEENLVNNLENDANQNYQEFLVQNNNPEEILNDSITETEAEDLSLDFEQNDSSDTKFVMEDDNDALNLKEDEDANNVQEINIDELTPAAFENANVIEDATPQEENAITPSLEPESESIEMNPVEEIDSLETETTDLKEVDSLDIETPNLSLEVDTNMSIELPDNDELLSTENTESLDVSDELDFSPIESLNIESNDHLPTETSVLDDNGLVLDLEENSDENNNELLLQEENDIIQKEKISMMTDFSKFDFNPETIEQDNIIDEDMLIKDIQDLANKRPELKILEVYNLYYKENKSVSAIASELNIDEELVIDALNEIIAII